MAEAMIHMGEAHARVLADGLSERILSYDDSSEWSDISFPHARKPGFTVIVPPEATLRIALPIMPANARQTRKLLEVSAPLLLRELIWTDAVPLHSGPGASVTVLRREWIDKRLSPIRRGMTSATLTIVDADGRAFRYRDTPARPRFLSIVGFVVAVSVSAAAFYGWQAIRNPAPAPIASARPGPPQAPPERIENPAEAKPRPAPSASGKAEVTLLGIAGRLPDDADVLVRTPWGKTTTIRLGDTIFGWKLVAVTSDRITLEKAGARDDLMLRDAR